MTEFSDFARGGRAFSQEGGIDVARLRDNPDSEARMVPECADWAEVRAREFARWVGGIWRSSAAAKVLVVFVESACFAGILRVTYLLLLAS